MKKTEKARLLVVDDEPDLMKSLCDILTEVGFSVKGFTSGKDALLALRREQFDLLVTDLVMPEMDGIALLNAALEIDPYLIGIILTGKGTIHNAVEALKMGAFYYILKPFKLKELLLILNRALGVKRLKETEEKYRLLFEEAIEGIYQITPDGCYITVNRAMARMLKYKSPEELISYLNKPDFQLYIEPHRYEKVIQLLKENDVVYGFESQVYCKDSSIIWISENVIVIRDENGKILFYRGSIEDITARKKTEIALKESERRLSTLIDNLPGMVYRCFNDSDWTMQYVSDGCFELTGYKPFELIHNREISYAKLILREHREDVWNKVQDALRESKPFQLEYCIKTKDNKIKWVWEKGRGITSEKNEVLALEGFITDITDRKKIEEELKVRIKELEDFYDMAVMRELKMKELKEEIEKLKEEILRYKGKRF